MSVGTVGLYRIRPSLNCRQLNRRLFQMATSQSRKRSNSATGMRALWILRSKHSASTSRLHRTTSATTALKRDCCMLCSRWICFLAEVRGELLQRFSPSALRLFHILLWGCRSKKSLDSYESVMTCGAPTCIAEKKGDSLASTKDLKSFSELPVLFSARRASRDCNHGVKTRMPGILGSKGSTS